MWRISIHARIRTYGIGLAMIAAAAASGSCLFDTATTRCEQYGLRCVEGTTCAAAQAICIPNASTCGNARIDPAEVCDDGNVIDGDGCSHDCKSNERCGNALVDFAIGESCDDGNNRDGDGCSADCRSAEVCGNRIVDTSVGEICDDGNTIGGDGCAADCKSTEVCGNRIVDFSVGEVCDDGNTIGGDGCAADCRSSD